MVFDKFSTDGSRKTFKDMQIVCREFANEFLVECITMIVLDFASIQGNPIENFIFVKPHNVSCEEDKYLVGSFQ